MNVAASLRWAVVDPLSEQPMFHGQRACSADETFGEPFLPGQGRKLPPPTQVFVDDEDPSGCLCHTLKLRERLRDENCVREGFDANHSVEVPVRIGKIREFTGGRLDSKRKAAKELGRGIRSMEFYSGEMRNQLTEISPMARAGIEKSSFPQVGESGTHSQDPLILWVDNLRNHGRVRIKPRPAVCRASVEIELGCPRDFL